MWKRRRVILSARRCDIIIENILYDLTIIILFFSLYTARIVFCCVVCVCERNVNESHEIVYGKL